MRTENNPNHLHLSLLNSSKNQKIPNTGLYSYDERAQGKGTWLVIINSGYNWEAFPEHFGQRDDPRPLRIWRVPSKFRDQRLNHVENEDGHWVPDDDYDYADPFDGYPEGHGTQTAMIAAGLRYGVARETALYLIKAGGAILDEEGRVVDEDMCPESLLVSLEHIVEKLEDGTLVKGKTVVIVDTLWGIENMKNEGNGFQDWFDGIENALHGLDKLGVVVTVAAGNGGNESPIIPTDAYMPNILSRNPNSPLILVGAVNSQGQLVRFTSPGSTRTPITCYAMGKGIKTIDLSIEQDTLQDGTTFSVAIVGGLTACYLSHPDFQERFQWHPDDPSGNTVGNRLKNWYSTEGEGSFQRVAADNLLDEPIQKWGEYPIPERVNTVYNYAHGSQS